MRAPGSFEIRLYRAALYLYPPSFRREFSAEMVRDLCEARQEPQVIAARRRVWAFRRRMAADLLKSILAQWVRTGWPAIISLSLLPLASTAAAATLWRPALFVLPSGTPDADVLAMLLLVVVLLFVIAATIIFTFWFAHPRLRRRR